MTLTVPPLRCVDASGAAVALPFVDGCYTVPGAEHLILTEPCPELHGPIVFGPESMLTASAPNPRAIMLFDGPAVIRRAYLGAPEERGPDELAATVWEVKLGGGRGECPLSLVRVVPD